MAVTEEKKGDNLMEMEIWNFGFMEPWKMEANGDLSSLDKQPTRGTF